MKFEFVLKIGEIMKNEKKFLQFLLERFQIERKKFDRSGVYAYTQRLLAYNSNKIEGSHARYECIHPFQDGNGRTGRLIIFRECLKNGIVPLIIEDSNRNEYIEALKAYKEEENLLQLVELFKKEQKVYFEKCSYFM